MNNITQKLQTLLPFDCLHTLNDFDGPSKSSEMHRYLEKKCANAYLDKKIKIADAEMQVEQTFESLGYRVYILENMLSLPACNYEILATNKHRKPKTLRKPCFGPGDVLTPQQRKDVVSIMVDTDVYIWQEVKAINMSGVPRTKYQRNRNTFRAARDGLWTTAINNFCTNISLNKGKLGNIPKKIASRGGSQSRFMPPRGSDAQSKRWFNKFYRVQKLLREERYLCDNFHLEERLVTDDPVLMEAQKSAKRTWTSTNRNPTVSAAGLFPVNEEGQVVSLSPKNEEVFREHLAYINDLEQAGKHYLGPYFCHKHEQCGYTLHAIRDCKPGEFFTYVGECRFEGDRYRSRVQDGEIEENENENSAKNFQDDLFTLIKHASGTAAWECVIDPRRYSNFGRYVGGTSPKQLDDANCMAFVVKVDGFYHLMIVVIKTILKGAALQYCYQGLGGESDYSSIPNVNLP